jgi:hypothetical protein
MPVASAKLVFSSVALRLSRSDWRVMHAEMHYLRIDNRPPQVFWSPANLFQITDADLFFLVQVQQPHARGKLPRTPGE